MGNDFRQSKVVKSNKALYYALHRSNDIIKMWEDQQESKKDMAKILGLNKKTFDLVLGLLGYEYPPYVQDQLELALKKYNRLKEITKRSKPLLSVDGE